MKDGFTYKRLPNFSTIFLIQSLVLLTGMVLFSLLLAWIFQINPFTRLHLRGMDLLVGVAVAPVLLLVATRVKEPSDQAQKLLGPMLEDASIPVLLLLAAAVGFSEELLFRGVLEPLLSRENWVVGLILTNLIFGAMHYLSIQYAVVAGLLGVVMSLLAYGPGEDNLLRAMVTHGAYDFFGFVLIAHRARQDAKQRGLETERPLEVDLAQDVAERRIETTSEDDAL